MLIGEFEAEILPVRASLPPQHPKHLLNSSIDLLNNARKQTRQRRALHPDLSFLSKGCFQLAMLFLNLEIQCRSPVCSSVAEFIISSKIKMYHIKVRMYYSLKR